ncbi:MAG: hypothetical protein HYV09_03040 [Deltaproteobacteria bacterium]|nr:hypothetical protein [Deltaproteobacteria bacterium]
MSGQVLLVGCEMRDAATLPAPTKITIDDTGAAIASYGDHPLLRFDTLDELMERLALLPGDLAAA